MGVLEALLLLVDFVRRGGRNGGLTSAMAVTILAGFSANEFEFPANEIEDIGVST